MSSIAPDSAVVLSSPHTKSSKLTISDLSSSASFSIIFCLKKYLKHDAFSKLVVTDQNSFNKLLYPAYQLVERNRQWLV